MGILAHQGGWDEMLLVAVPLTLIWLLLRVANRRADRHLREQDDSGHDDSRETPAT